MCNYLYLHHHHIPPCTRPVEVAVHYVFCGAASTDLSTGQRTPCPYTQLDETQSAVDPDDPCASGGCLDSPDCSTGACRLAQLGGRWVCCRCGGGRNVSRRCWHALNHSPDTFCYHVCCHECRPDEGVPGGRSGGGGNDDGDDDGGGGHGSGKGKSKSKGKGKEKEKEKGRDKAKGSGKGKGKEVAR